MAGDRYILEAAEQQGAVFALFLLKRSLYDLCGAGAVGGFIPARSHDFPRISKQRVVSYSVSAIPAPI